jgi:hypothetical protein
MGVRTMLGYKEVEKNAEVVKQYRNFKMPNTRISWWWL